MPSIAVAIKRARDGDKPYVHGIASCTASKRMLPFVVYLAADFVASAFKEHEGAQFLFVGVSASRRLKYWLPLAKATTDPYRADI